MLLNVLALSYLNKGYSVSQPLASRVCRMPPGQIAWLAVHICPGMADWSTIGSMTDSFSGRVTVPEGVLFKELDGETVLLDLASENYFKLDEVGTRIWQLLAENGDPEQAFKTILREFEVDRDTLRVDMDLLLSQLLDAGLLKSSNDEVTPESP